MKAPPAVRPLGALRVGAAVGALVLATSCTGPAVQLPLERELLSMLDSLDARSALYAKHLPSGREIAIRADESMNTLSVIKIAIMIQAFRDAEAGRIRLNDRYTIQPDDLRRGSGLIQTFDAGLSPTYRDLIEQMIVTSDNTATDIVLKTVVLGRVNQMLELYELPGTRINLRTADLFKEVWVRTDSANVSLTDREVFERGFPRGSSSGIDVGREIEADSAKWLGRTTAREMATLLEGILHASYANAEHSQMMVDILKRQFYTSRLPRRLQARLPVEVAHKTGDWPPYAGNDVGILFYDGGPTIVSIFTSENRSDFLLVEQTLGRIAERLVEEWR